MHDVLFIAILVFKFFFSNPFVFNLNIYPNLNLNPIYSIATGTKDWALVLRRLLIL